MSTACQQEKIFYSNQAQWSTTMEFMQNGQSEVLEGPPWYPKACLKTDFQILKNNMSISVPLRKISFETGF